MSNELELLKFFKSRFPVDVRALAKQLGIKYLQADLPDNQSGLIRKELDGSFTISVNIRDGKQRQRFTCAHELGHYFLHRDLLLAGGDHFDRLYDGHNDSGVLSPSDEAQANRFAAETLMPKAEILRCYKSGCDVASLAKLFEVSKKALSWRLVNLGLANKSELGLQ